MKSTVAAVSVGNGVWRIINAVLSANSYVCATGTGGDCFLVDPGSERDVIQDLLDAEGLTPRHIVLTHGHFDHCGSAAYFRTRYQCEVRLHLDDIKLLKASNFLMMAFKIPFTLEVPDVEGWRELSLGVPGGAIEFIHSPGHTPGSSVIRYGRAAFTGDTLFTSGMGLSRLPGEDSGQLRATLLRLLDTLAPDTIVYPGHGEPAAFVGVRQDNAALRAFLGEAATAPGRH